MVDAADLFGEEDRPGFRSFKDRHELRRTGRRAEGMDGTLKTPSRKDGIDLVFGQLGHELKEVSPDKCGFRFADQLGQAAGRLPYPQHPVQLRGDAKRHFPDQAGKSFRVRRQDLFLFLRKNRG